MKCAGRLPARRARVRAWVPPADRAAVLMGDRFPGSRAACTSGRLTLRLLPCRQHVHQPAEYTRGPMVTGNCLLPEVRSSGRRGLPVTRCDPPRECQDAWRWATDSGGSTGWPATMRWQDASYALTTCICQERGIIRPYGVGRSDSDGRPGTGSGTGQPAEGLCCKENCTPRRGLCGLSRSTNGGWANDQPLVGFRPILSPFPQAGHCWKCPDNFYTISLRNFSQESPPRVFGVQCATSAPLL